MPSPFIWPVVALLALSVACLAVRLTRPPSPVVVGYAEDRASDTVHVVMATAMIVMFATPAAVSHQTWRWVLGALVLGCACWLAVVIATRSGATAITSAGFHTFAAATMLYAMSGAAHAAPMHHHMDHGSMYMGHDNLSTATGFTWTPLTYALIVVFLADAVGTIVLAARATTAPKTARFGVFPHVAMDLGTVMMLVAALPG